MKCLAAGPEEEVCCGVCQVVLRNGAPIDAEVPDYRELDTVPNERRYTADQPLPALGPGHAPPNPPQSPSSVSVTDTVAFNNQVAVDAGGKPVAALDGKVNSRCQNVYRLLP